MWDSGTVENSGVNNVRKLSMSPIIHLTTVSGKEQKRQPKQEKTPERCSCAVDAVKICSIVINPYIDNNILLLFHTAEFRHHYRHNNEDFIFCNHV